jgi:hypothetical protein
MVSVAEPYGCNLGLLDWTVSVIQVKICREVCDMTMLSTNSANLLFIITVPYFNQILVGLHLQLFYYNFSPKAEAADYIKLLSFREEIMLICDEGNIQRNRLACLEQNSWFG